MSVPSPVSGTRWSWQKAIFLIIAAGIFGAAAWSWLGHGLLFEMLRSDVDSAHRLVVLKNTIKSYGTLAPIAYVVFVITEVVVAPLPGLMLYAPGGLIFGPTFGACLAIVGNIIGAAIACSITRMLSPRFAERFFSGPTLVRVQGELERRGVWMIFFLRLNPLTSSDLLSYAAGLTRIPISHVVLATAAGLAPHCVIQAWLSDRVLNAFPQLIGPLVIAAVASLIFALWILFRVFQSGTARSGLSSAARDSGV
ncbi:MAG: TVP38/TMEM64 family protein [Planctomyces sp.]